MYIGWITVNGRGGKEEGKKNEEEDRMGEIGMERRVLPFPLRDEMNANTEVKSNVRHQT